ncbi:MAG: DJ/PfpI family protein [Phycisphaerales bacterium]|nr:DJ/PfpI family protein [Phycisphaerales bacterium]
MTSHSWKCVTCAQSYRSKKEPTRTPKCPTCGALLVPDLRAVPSPQPHSSATRPRSTTTASSRPSSRPAGPEEAMALVASSSAWVPDPEPGPSPSTPGIRNASGRNRMTAADGVIADPATPAPAQALASRPSVRLWAAVGGVAVAVVVAVIVIMNRPGPPTRSPANPPTVASATPSPSPSPVTAPALSPATVASASISAEPPVVVAPAALRTVNLLKLIDPAVDTMAGVWKLNTGEFAPQLSSDATHHARINIAYQPPEEYDFRVDFTRSAGDNCMTQIFTHQNPCCLVLFGWKGTVSGFQQINNQSADKNATGVRNLSTTNGQRHTSVVKVRKTFIEAWLDGNLITRYDTDGSDMSAKDWKVDAPLGVGTQLSPTIFHTIELTEITGTGRSLR